MKIPPSSPGLIAAAFEDKMRAYTATITQSLRDAAPWNGFCTFIDDVCRMQAQDRGFADVLTLTFPTAQAFEEERDQSAYALTELLDRAKATGQLREDFAHQDVPLILMANAGVVNATASSAPEAWRRLVGYLIQAFAADPASQRVPPVPGPPSKHQMYRALMRLTDTPQQGGE